METISTSIPIPPTQWVKDLQKRIPLGKASTLSMTVAPVVEKPDTDSNKASEKESTLPDKIKGNEPKRDAKTHAKVTIVKPSFIFIVFDLAGKRDRIIPINPVTAMVMANATLSCWLCIKDITVGKIIINASRTRIFPSVFVTMP